MEIKFTIKPDELLSMQNIKFHRRGNWYSCKICPFCEGGRHGQQYTFGVRVDDYNYHCLRTTCGASGNFWMLLKHFGLNPKDYVDKENSKFNNKKRKQSKKFIYRSQNV